MATISSLIDGGTLQGNDALPVSRISNAGTLTNVKIFGTALLNPYTNYKDLSSNWQNTYTNFRNLSSNWQNTYTTVNGLSSTWNEVNSKLAKGSNIDVSRVGEQTYIDVDIKGSFDGPQSSYYSSPYFILERDGSVVGLRGGSSDGLTEKQYFATASDRNLTGLKNTDNEYRPPFLLSTEFVSTIIDGNEHGFYCLIKSTVGAADKYYWVHINGTMNPFFHTFDNVTTLAATTNINISLGSIVYCKELDWWLTVFKSNAWSRERKELNYRFYRKSDSALMATYTKRVGVAGQTVLPGGAATTDFNVELTHTDPGFTIYGFTVNITNQQRANLRYSLNGNSLLISDLCSFYIDGVTWDTSCNYNSVFTYNTGTSTFTEEYAFPHRFNMQDTGSWTSPFFSLYSHVPGTAGANWWAGWKFFQRKSPNSDVIVATYKEWGASVVQYGVRTDSINNGSTWEDVLRRPFHATNRPHTQNNMIWSVPTDASLLGKQLINGYFISPNKIRSLAYSKQPNEAIGSQKWAISNISNIASRRNILGGNNNALEVPSTITQDTTITDYLRPAVSVVRSDGTMRIKRYNSSTRVFSEWNGDTMMITADNMATLPSDWVTRIDNLLTTDADYTGPAFTNRGSYLYHLTGNLFLHTFTYAKTGENRSYCSLLQVTPNTGAMTWVGTKRQLETSTGAGIGDSIVTDNAYQSAGIYFATDNSIYVIFELPLTQGHIHRVYAIKTNTAQNNITNWANTGVWNGWWHQVQTGIHPTFGPHVMFGHSNNYATITMSYRNRTTIADMNTRITGCYDQILTGRLVGSTTVYDGLAYWDGGSGATGLEALSLQSATGFIVYNSDTSVFIKGKEYIMSTSSSDMNNSSLWVDSKPSSLQNRTVYVYVIISNNQAKIMFSQLRVFTSYGSVYLGEITTNISGIASSNISGATVIGTSIYINNNTNTVTIPQLAGTGTRSIGVDSNGTLAVIISDKNYKTNIAPITNALEKTLNLNGVFYNYKNEPFAQKNIGVIAQDVEKIVPELVFTDTSNGEPVKGVHYNQITALLIEAVKELKTELEELKSKIKNSPT
jgi:hypothetical protein